MKLHIGNLPKNISDAELSEIVDAFGKPTLLEIARDRHGESKGFGFAEYADAAQAQAAITGLDGKEVKGQAIKVSEARPRKADAARP